MKLVAAAFASLALLASTKPAHAAPITDVFDRPVPVGTGRPALVFYANQETRSVVGQNGLKLAYDVRDERPVVIVRVDLSGVPGLFHGVAERELRKSQQACIAEMRQQYIAHGETPPEGLEDSLFMIADEDGEAHRKVGLPEKFTKPLARALGPTGKELARGVIPAAKSKLAAAIVAAKPTATASN